ncbi:hypothetical protein [Paraburkholderia sp. SIMBA_030]|uniref:hypothetical protein n=1 Tax=Paraburkholderia sp. SIMBA_030 TaxID=3085773 RepID=UPI00397C7C7C
MSRINVSSAESATGATAEVFAEVKKAAGRVPNLFVALGALAPQVLRSVLNAEGVLGTGTLSKQEVETIRNWWRSRWPSR